MTMIDKGVEYENNFLFAKTVKNKFFGAYLSESLRKKYHDFYDIAETFIFTLNDTDKKRVFPAIQENDLYIYTDPDKNCFWVFCS